METMVDAKFKAIQAKLAASSGGRGMLSAFTGATPALQSLEHQITRTGTAAAGLGRSLDRISGTFNTGLGIGIAVGGLALLERSFSKAIEKAREFQTAQLAIAATLQSSYRLVGARGDIGGGAAFGRMQAEAGKLNQEIIRRQAVNILTYQEQLSSFQSSLNAGARKGLKPGQVMDVSEQLAIVARTLGLRGEEIANASRIGLGGAVNVSRSTIGRALGITNEDISKRSGDDLMKFLMEKTKGFQAGAPSFAKSIEGVTSTLEARIDVFMAKVGQKFMKQATPIIESFGAALEGTGSDKFAETLTAIFNGVLKAIEAIAKSPVIPMITKFLEFLAGFGDKILIAGVFGKILTSILGATAGLKSFLTTLQAVAVEAGVATPKIAGVAVAQTAVGAAGMAASGGVSRGVYPGGVAGAAGLAGIAMMAPPGTGGVTNLPWYRAKYAAAQAADRMAPPGTGGVTNFKWYRDRYAARAKLDASFNQFAETAAYTGGVPASALEAEAGAAGAMSASRAARIKQRLGKLGAVGMTGLMKGLGPAALSFMGTELVKSRTDQSENENIRAAGGFLQGGLTAGIGLAAAGVPAPIAILGGILAGTIEGVNSHLQALAEQVEKAENAFEAFAEAHPNAAAASAINRQISRITEYEASGALSPEYAAKRRAELIMARQDQREAGRAEILKQDSIKDAEAKAQAAAAAMQGLSLGYGGANARRRIEQEAVSKEAQIAVMQGKGELAPSAADKEAAAATFQRYEAARAALKKRQQQQVIAGQPMTPTPDWMNKFRSQEDVEQSFAAASARGEIRSELQDKLTARDLKRQQLLAGTSPNIESQRKAGALGLEQQLIGQKSEFDTLGQWAQYAAKARDAFNQAFNMPLKRMEGQMQALGLGSASENVVEAAKLTYNITLAKLKELAKAFDIPAKTIRALQVQARAEMQAKEVQDRYDKAHQAYGGTAEGRILGRAESSNRLKSLANQAELAGAQGKTEEEERIRAQMDIEGKRATMSPAEHGQYAQARMDALGKKIEDAQKAKRLDEIQSAFAAQREQASNAAEARQMERTTQDYPALMAEKRIRVEQAGMGVEQAGLNVRKANIAETLDSGVGPYGKAAAAIRYKVESEQKFDPAEYERAYRESIAIKKQENEMAKRSAALELKMSQIMEERASIDLVRTEQDYNTALANYTMSLRERMATSGGGAGAIGGGDMATQGLVINVTGEMSMTSDQISAMGESIKGSFIQDMTRRMQRS
jgi:hypothetical protein